jgi:hypothetical protein
MSQQSPQLHDVYEAHKRMYEAIRINNIDEILKKPDEASRIDPVSENMSLMYGKSIRAFPEQDHESHIAVHLQFAQDPSLAGNPGAAGMQPLLIAHIAEHIALLYRQKMEAGIGMALPMLPNLRDPKFRFEDIDPQLDMMISQRAAEVVAKSPEMDAIAPLAQMMQRQQQQQQQNNPLQYAAQLAKLEADALKARTEVQIQADQAKAQQKLAISEAEAKQDLQIEQAKLQADLQAKVAKLELDLQIEREKNAIKLQQEINENANSNNPIRS